MLAIAREFIYFKKCKKMGSKVKFFDPIFS